MAGAFVIAGWKVGGALLTFSMGLFMITRDNPFLAPSSTTFKINLNNLLKNCAVAGAGLLLYIKRTKIVHRKDDKVKRKKE